MSYDANVATIPQTSPLAGYGETTSSSSSSSTSVDDTKNQFLQMLITQLQNQDPLSPMDTTQFTQQMMMMGQLEQLFNLNENVATMATAQQGSLISQYSGLVGKDVLANGNQFQVDGEDKGAFTFNLPGTPASTTINVFDNYGNLVRDFDAAIDTSGDHTVNFDGKDNRGNVISDGYYSYTVDAIDHDGKSIIPTTYSRGAISSIRLENGSPIFQMGSNDVNIQQIKQIF